MDGRKNFQSGRCSKCISKSTICVVDETNLLTFYLHSNIRKSYEIAIKCHIAIKDLAINKIIDTLQLNFYYNNTIRNNNNHNYYII